MEWFHFIPDTVHMLFTVRLPSVVRWVRTAKDLSVIESLMAYVCIINEFIIYLIYYIIVTRLEYCSRM